MNFSDYDITPAYLVQKLNLSLNSDTFKAAFESFGFVVQQQDTAANDDFQYYLINDDEEKLVFVSGETDEARCFYYSVLLGLMNLTDSRDADESQMIQAYIFASKIRQEIENNSKSKISESKLRNVLLSIFAVMLTVSVAGLIFLYRNVNRNNMNPLENSLPATVADMSSIIDDAAVVDNEDINSVVPEIAVAAVSISSPSEDSASSDLDVSNESVQSSSNKMITKEDVPSSTVTYYATASGKKYHISGCQYVKDLSKCVLVSDDDIVLGKYEPCKKCIK